MSIDLSSQFAQFFYINLPKTESIVFDAAVARKLRYRIDSIRLHAHTYSFTHNLTHRSLKPTHALEFGYRHEWHGLNIHVDDGGKYTLKHNQLAHNITYTQRLMLRTSDR